ncbi:transcription factor UPBEAT1-like [Actinidia eriantha]|uniref:transcription factor UPBEAT1-like n=1 Tax=Actinidia eriantha TaxID=165200 RepID=UPI00258954E6|nr:transcription factor UPBEAT1-like [Actinidia eriantha]
MGSSSQPFFVALDWVGHEGRCHSSRPLALEAQGRKQRAKKRLRMRTRSRRILMKRRAGRFEGCRRSMEKKVRTLRKLVPNSESVGLDGLFRVAAMHIRSLQMRVKAMQVMVDVLAGSDQ